MPAGERRELFELDLVGVVRQTLVDPREIMQRDLQRLADAGQAIQIDFSPRSTSPMNLPLRSLARPRRSWLKPAVFRSWRILVPTILRVFVIM
jgi:hypothetical protein